MKKLSLALLCVLLSIHIGYTQQQLWEDIPGFPGEYHEIIDLYTDTLDNYLYVAGDFHEFNGMPYKGIARWDGQKWDSLAGGADKLFNYKYGSPIYTMTRYQSDLYVGGMFADLDGIPIVSIGKWNGSEWDSLPVPPFHGDYWHTPWVMELEVIDNKLFLCGTFGSVAGQSCHGVAAWNGSFWESYSIYFDFTAAVTSVAEYDGTLYAAGDFDESGDNGIDTLQDIVRWTNEGWRSVGGGMKGWFGGITSMVVYEDELYVAGSFLKSGGNIGNKIQRWNGREWSGVGGGIWGGKIDEMQVHDGKLYVVGTFDYAGGVPAQYIAIWDGTNWCGLGSTFDNTVSGDIEFYHDTLYIAGNFWSIDGDSSKSDFVKWVGGNYVEICGNTTAVEEQTAIEKIKIFPNPASSWLNIQLPQNAISKNTTYQIFNMQGKMVLHGNVTQTTSLKINIQTLASGLYGCVLTNQTGSYTAKFVMR